MVQANVFDIEDGSRYIFDESKLSSNLHKLSFGLEKRYMDIDYAIRKIQSGISDRLTKDEFVVYVGESLNELVTKHPDFSILAARVEVQHLHEKLGGMKFTENLRFLRCINANSRRAIPNSVKRARKDQLADESSGSIISGKFYQLAMKHREIIDNAIRPERDYDFSYFGWKTLCKSYLLKSDLGTVHETPQFLLMRTALAIHGPFGDVDRVIETYNLMSEKYFIHASPTLFNSGTANQYLSSCFLLGINEDSIDGIYKTLHKTAMISKASGGIGIHVSNIRACGSSISSSRGRSSGIVPMLRVFNNTARYVDQGGNKRPGAFCIYLEPWHSDIFDFLQLRKNHGKEEMRARDLFYGLWIPDLFMRRVKSNDDWSLFSPDDAPGLSDCYGEEFEKLYEKYELEVKPMRIVKAQQLWKEILLSQIETGGPFMLYKDSCNKKSNQKNLGTIKSSNLCCEIIEYSSPTEVAVCNLASVALPRFVKTEASKTWFDYKMLHNVVKVITRNLDHIIDICDYPVPEAEYSNKKNRPLAIGVQGFADMLMMLRLPFESDETTRLNKVIFETIYHAALETSIELAEEYGPYGSFKGSPASEGLLQFDLWGLKEDNYSFYYKDWEKLKQKLSSGPGMRNSLLVAPMPTASTSQILGFTESFEPMTSMIYTRRVLSGEYTLVNKYMVQMFCDLDIWDEKLKNTIIANNGSIQEIEGIPQQLKNLFKTVWEVSQKRLVDLSSERAPFIDQSQSLNLFLDTPTMGKLTSMHFYAWEKGLKTGMYYLRTKAASSAIKFTINTDNTLTTPVQVPDLAALESVEYVEKTPFDDKDQSTSPSARATPFSILLDRNKSKDDEFGIHDSTPLSCSLIEGSTCDSCSG